MLAKNFLSLDWRPLLREVIRQRFPPESSQHLPIFLATKKPSSLSKILSCARYYFDMQCWRDVLDTLLPYYNPTRPITCTHVIQTLNHFLPANPPDDLKPELQARYWLPSIFHLWKLLPNQAELDVGMLRLLSHVATDYRICCELGPYGLFSREQFSFIMTVVFRHLHLPVGGLTGSYDQSNTIFKSKERREKFGKYLAIIMLFSISPAVKPGQGIFGVLDDFIRAIATYVHPSNTGTWTSLLTRFFAVLSVKFLARWNMESDPNGRLHNVAPHQHLNDELKRHFVLLLRPVVFSSIHAKRGSHWVADAIGRLATLEPDLILPGVLKRVYPALISVLETHRTNEALILLNSTASAFCTSPRYRAHVFCLMGLMIPAIDANDVPKTTAAMAFLASISARIPLHDISDDHNAAVAANWAAEETERLESLIGDDDDLPSNSADLQQQLDLITRSSTAGLEDFVIAFMDRLLAQADNFPDASMIDASLSESEETWMQVIKESIQLIFASLQPQFLDIAFSKMEAYIATSITFQARTIVGFICGSLAQVNAKKTCNTLLPLLINNVRFELVENKAGSKRSAGLETLLQDRLLDSNLRFISRVIDNAGGEHLLRHMPDLQSMISLVFDRCLSTSASIEGAANLSCILHALVGIYPQDWRPLEENENLSLQDWGKSQNGDQLKISWHLPTQSELQAAFKLTESFLHQLVNRIQMAMGESTQSHSSNSLHHPSKQLSDDIARYLRWLGSPLLGLSTLHPASPRALPNDSSLRDQFLNMKYPSGDVLKADHPLLKTLLELHNLVGELISRVFNHVQTHYSEDVQCQQVIADLIAVWLANVHTRTHLNEYRRHYDRYSVQAPAFSEAGRRKCYPRFLFVKRALLYHLLRRSYNCRFSSLTQLETQMVLHLSSSAHGSYLTVRVAAQQNLQLVSGLYSPVKELVAPNIFAALASGNIDAIKGALWTLQATEIGSHIFRSPVLAQEMVLAAIEAVEKIDKNSVVSLVERTMLSFITKLSSRAYDWVINLDKTLMLNTVNLSFLDEGAVSSMAEKKSIRRSKSKTALMEIRKFCVERLGQISYWRLQCLIISLIAGLESSSQLPDSQFITLFAGYLVSPHPDLRQAAISGLIGSCNTIWRCALSDDNLEVLLQGRYIDRHIVELDLPTQDPSFHLPLHISSNEQSAEDIFIDRMNTGWLIEKTPIQVEHRRIEDQGNDFVPQVKSLLKDVSSIITSQYIKKYCSLISMESREGLSSSFRPIAVHFGFEIMRMSQMGQPSIMEEWFSAVKDMFGNGDDKNAHRALAEISAAMLISTRFCSAQIRQEILAWFTPLFEMIVTEKLTPDTLPTWLSFTGSVYVCY